MNDPHVQTQTGRMAVRPTPRVFELRSETHLLPRWRRLAIVVAISALLVVAALALGGCSSTSPAIRQAALDLADAVPDFLDGVAPCSTLTAGERAEIEKLAPKIRRVAADLGGAAKKE